MPCILRLIFPQPHLSKDQLSVPVLGTFDDAFLCLHLDDSARIPVPPLVDAFTVFTLPGSAIAGILVLGGGADKKKKAW